MAEVFSLALNESIHDISVKRHANARRLTLRVDPARRIRLTVPLRCSERRMQDFLREHLAWLQTQIENAPQAAPFAPGATLPLRGVAHRIAHDEKARGVSLEPGTITVGGDARHLRRRLADFLKKEAKRDFEAATARYASVLNARVRRMQLRDTTTRWGSCSRSGVICYSWRLVFAPPFVLDYLCAHEVAHLRHMDHSKRYWALVEEICPHMKEARAWLKANGNALLAIGA